MHDSAVTIPPANSLGLGSKKYSKHFTPNTSHTYLSIFKNFFFYKLLGGKLSGNTCKKSAGVYEGIPMVYFGGYMYCTNNMFTVLFMYQQYVYGCASCFLWLYMSF